MKNEKKNVNRHTVKRGRTHRESVDGKLTLWGFYNRNLEFIQEQKDWQASTCVAYDGAISNEIVERLRDKALEDLTADDYDAAYKDICRAKTDCTEETRRKYWSHMYTLAEIAGRMLGVDNPLYYTSLHNKLRMESVNTEKGREVEEEELQRRQSKTRLVVGTRLALEETIRIWKLILNGYQEHGEYLGIAIMLWCGTRTSEGLALDHRDFQKMEDMTVASIYKRSDHDKRTVRYIGKSDNAYRTLPVMPPLAELMEKRAKELKALYSGEDVGKFPAVCKGNQHNVRANLKEINRAMSMLFREAKVSQDVMIQADEIVRYELESSKENQEETATSYLLRHNFATMIFGAGLLLMQCQYCMGHRIDEPGVKRSDFTNPDLIRPIHEAMKNSWLMLDSEVRTIRVAGSMDLPAVDNAVLTFADLPAGVEMNVQLSLEATVPNSPISVEPHQVQYYQEMTGLMPLEVPTPQRCLVIREPLRRLKASKEQAVEKELTKEIAEKQPIPEKKTKRDRRRPLSNVLLLATAGGFVKRVDLDQLACHNRGGQGQTVAKVKDGDCVTAAAVLTESDEGAYVFTASGYVISVNLSEFPAMSLHSRGARPDWLPKGDQVACILPSKAVQKAESVYLLTDRGMLLYRQLPFFKRYAGPVEVIKLLPGDQLKTVVLRSTAGRRMTIISAGGRGLCLAAEEIQLRQGVAQGLIGIRFDDACEDHAVALLEHLGSDTAALVTADGQGKRIVLDDLTVVHSGGLGMIVMKIDEKEDCLVRGADIWKSGHDLVLVTEQGMALRCNGTLTARSRMAGGVKLMSIREGDRVAAMCQISADM